MWFVYFSAYRSLKCSFHVCVQTVDISICLSTSWSHFSACTHYLCQQNAVFLFSPYTASLLSFLTCPFWLSFVSFCFYPLSLSLCVSISVPHSRLDYSSPSSSSGQSPRAGGEMSVAEWAVQPPVEGAGEVPTPGWEVWHSQHWAINSMWISWVAQQIPVPAS